MSSMRRKITLKLSDGKGYEVDDAVALKSETIQRRIEDGSADIDIVIDMPNVTSMMFAKALSTARSTLMPRVGSSPRTILRPGTQISPFLTISGSVISCCKLVCVMTLAC